MSVLGAVLGEPAFRYWLPVRCPGHRVAARRAAPGQGSGFGGPYLQFIPV